MSGLIVVVLVLAVAVLMGLVVWSEWHYDGWTVLGRARNKERRGPGLKADLNKNSHAFNGVAQSKQGSAR